MRKSVEKPEELVEADFKELQKLIERKHGKEYTLSYIRKVCKGSRNNDHIIEIAEKYILLLKELEIKIDNLSKNISNE